MMLNVLKEKYWQYQEHRQLINRLKQAENQFFAEYIAKEKQRVLQLASEIGPENNQKRLAVAVGWLLKAQAATKDKGVSLGFFPLSKSGGWMASYPETTGYITTTLLKYADQVQNHKIKQAALDMADWEISIQMPNGAVQGGPLCSAEKQTAASFNTGMVADGWASAYQLTSNEKYLNAAVKAANFLADDMNEDGFFKTNGEFVSKGEVKTYTCLCAWAMYRVGQMSNEQRLMDAAIISIEAALRQRNDRGWFKNNCLTHSDQPLTHTIGYVLQGILEVGILAERADFVDAAKYSLKGALSAVENNGYLSARLNRDWKATANYVCLTGSVQLAIIAYRIAEYDGDTQFISNGNKLINFAKATQLLEGENEAMIGAIAGSFPIMGDYMVAGYPNWATKYFIDALMLQSSS